jgi:hypothetical protein
MPDVTGRLSAEDFATIQRWWKETWKAPVVCPVCKTREWSVGDHLVNIQRYAVDAAAPNTETYPQIMVSCKKCSHAMFFSAVRMGVSPPYRKTTQVNALANPSNPLAPKHGL